MKYTENKNTELKENYTTNIYKTISAFSNQEGGSIFLGVNDQGEVVGVLDIIKLKLNIENTINDSFVPRPNLEFKNEVVGNKSVLEIIVQKGNNPPYFYKSISYMRTDTSTVPMDSLTLSRYILSSENIGFDELDIRETNLTFDYLGNKLDKIIGLSEINESVLITLGLKKKNKYNKASLLLSDNNNLANSYIDIAKFKINNDIFLDRVIFKDESILKYYYNLLDLFEKYYPAISIVSVPTRVDKEQIPFVAFKEAILNAIIHRDYSINRGIQISMYDYKIEINSPGGLPEGINEEDYLTGGISIPRNKVLSSLFFRLGIIESFGTGIKRIIKEYNDSGEKPSFIIKDNYIKIILPVIGFEYNKLNNEEAILTYLKSHPFSPRSNIEKVLKIEKTTLLRKINELIERGIVKKQGIGPSVSYYI